MLRRRTGLATSIMATSRKAQARTKCRLLTLIVFVLILLLVFYKQHRHGDTLLDVPGIIGPEDKQLRAEHEKQRRMNKEANYAEELTVFQKRHHYQSTFKKVRCTCIHVSNNSIHESWCSPNGGTPTSRGVICFVQNLCLINGSALVFLSDQLAGEGSKRTLAPPTAAAHGVRMDPFARFADLETVPVDLCNSQPKSYVMYKDDASVDTPMFSHRDIEKAKWVDGTTLLIAQSFAMHITHFMEGLGLVSARAIQENGAHYHRNGSVIFKPCSVSDMSCMGHPDQVVSLSHAIEEDFVFFAQKYFPRSPEKFEFSLSSDSWHRNVLSFLMRDIDRSTSITFSRPEELRKRFGSGDVCFNKAILPGWQYDVFPSVADEVWDTMRRDMWQVIRRQQRAQYMSMRSIAQDGVSHIDTREVAFRDRQRDASSRVILLSKRDTRRSVVDWDVFEHIVRSVAKQVSAEVKVIEFGKHGFTEQATAAAEADILVGIHGADLTNMIFQNRGSVLIELNPIFFFENRFFDIAETLGLEYLAWTCTARTCAFADRKGDAAKEDADWKANIIDKGVPFDEKERKFHLPPLLAGAAGLRPEFTWPWDRYAGNVCPECASMASSEWMQDQYYKQIRQSSVRVSKHAKEIEHVFWKAFEKLGWASAERVVVKKEERPPRSAKLDDVKSWLMAHKGYDSDEAEELGWRYTNDAVN